ncbi:MAG: PSD1 domain-containing protein [Verrucomicrobiae bacterium]|nr:PSD1 domain-containing protein [Verrucomicrobiae bacterium]
MKRFPIASSLLFLCPVVVPISLSAQSDPELSGEQIDFFESKIRPVLVEQCYQCHSTEADKVKGGLLLDSREASLRGGDNGHAVVPGNLDQSLLITAIRYQDSDLEMPPKKKLADHVIADFEKWISMGAPDPREEQKSEAKVMEKYSSTIDVEKGRGFWAYQKPRKSELPTVSDSSWPRTELDHFILAALDAKEIAPSEDADPRTLIRRLYFDLIGLPPSPEQVEPFVAGWQRDPEKALRAAVDELLDSPGFGERWGRHWLDVARYGESTGKEANALYPYAWRYRDYVIDAFNADKPYDEFIQEQIAGDLLPHGSDDELAEHLVATGFLAIGTKSLNDQNNRQFRFDLVDEQIDTASRAVLATTVACARCHDHKFDPIPMSDYYAMAGIFLSSDTYYGTAQTAQSRHNTDLVSLPIPDRNPPIEPLSLGNLIDLQFQLEQRQKDLREQVAEAAELRRSGDTDGAQRITLGLLRVRSDIGLIEAKIARYDADGYPRPLAMAVKDSSEPFDSQLLIRGEEGNATSERVPRGFVQVIQSGDEEPVPADQSGRLQLAQWMTSPENPLASRVMVNRIWHWLFGAGLVTSVDNFGATGQTPSHPELLDYLAVRFVEKNWSMKEMIREIVLSRTYRQSSAFKEPNFLKDPDNHLLWRMTPRRLEAEQIRDAVLAISGTLQLERPIGSSVAQSGDGFVGRTVRDQASLTAETDHRSVYLPIVRDLVPESLELFDFADPSLMTGARETTTVPSQALYLMNSDFIIKNAEAMAKRLTEDMGLRGNKLGQTAFYLAYSRPPTEEEGRKTLAYFERFLATAKESGLSETDARRLGLVTFCQSLLSSAEFRYLN